MGYYLSKLYEAFFAIKLDICLIGLENVGKTTFVNSLMDTPKVTIPTIGLNIKEAKRGKLSMKIWDIGGQLQYRRSWGDYAKMCDIIIFMIDCSNYETIPTAKRELQLLLEEKGIEGKPVLILGNKTDIEPHMSEVEIIKELNLDYVYTNQWGVVSISALHGNNLDDAIEWITIKKKK